MNLFSTKKTSTLQKLQGRAMANDRIRTEFQRQMDK